MLFHNPAQKRQIVLQLFLLRISRKRHCFLFDTIIVSQHAVLGKVLSLRPVVGQALVIVSRKRLCQLIRNFLQQNGFVQKIFHIVERISVIKIHGTAGGFKGCLRLLCQGCRIEVEEHTADFLPLLLPGIKREIQIPDKIRNAAVASDCLDRGSSKGFIEPVVIVVLHDRGSDQHAVIVKMTQAPRHLIFLFIQNRLQAKPRPMIVIKRIQQIYGQHAEGRQCCRRPCQRPQISILFAFDFMFPHRTFFPNLRI